MFSLCTTTSKPYHSAWEAPESSHLLSILAGEVDCLCIVYSPFLWDHHIKLAAPPNRHSMQLSLGKFLNIFLNLLDRAVGTVTTGGGIRFTIVFSNSGPRHHLLFVTNLFHSPWSPILPKYFFNTPARKFMKGVFMMHHVVTYTKSQPQIPKCKATKDPSKEPSSSGAWESSKIVCLLIPCLVSPNWYIICSRMRRLRNHHILRPMLPSAR